MPRNAPNRTISRLRADALLVVVTLIWGSTFTVVKDAIEHVPPMSFLAFRFAVAFAVLALLYRGRTFAGGRRSWGPGVITGVALFAGFALQTAGLASTTPARAAFITGLCVVLVPLFATIALRKPPPWTAAAGVILAAAGLGLLTLSGPLEPGMGDLLVLLCAVAFAWHILLTGRFTQTVDPIPFTAAQIAATGILSAGAALATGTLVVPEGAAVWTAVVLCGALATSLAYALQSALQRFTTPTHTALIFTLEPVFATLFSYALTGERLTGHQLLGGLLVLLGMVLAEAPDLWQGFRQRILRRWQAWIGQAG